MSKCGKGCMPECEYFTTGGCISPFNCPYKIETGYINSATSIPTYMEQYNGMSDDDIERCLERLSTCKTTDVMNFDYAGTLAYIERLKTETAALRARLGKFDDLHIHMGEKVYIIADDNEIIERFICGVHILSTEIIFVTTTQKNYKTCNKKGIAAHIAHAIENSFGLIPLRDFGERAFIHRESALVRLAELKGRER